MADRAGSLIGIRANAGPIRIKVTDYEYDTEKKFNRAVTSDALQHPRTVFTSIGGIVKGTGFVDPTDTAIIVLLAAASDSIGTQDDLTSVEFLLDVSETGGARHGWNMGNSKLHIATVGGQTDEGGMTRVNFEIHSQAGSTYSSTLT